MNLVGSNGNLRRTKDDRAAIDGRLPFEEAEWLQFGAFTTLRRQFGHDNVAQFGRFVFRPFAWTRLDCNGLRYT